MRGKQAAKAARRDAEELQGRLEQLQQRFDRYREEATEDIRALRAEKQRLQDQLRNEVVALAHAQLAHAEQRHTEQVMAVQRQHYETLVQIVDVAWKDTGMNTETAHKILELADVKLGDVPTAASHPAGDRSLRRTKGKALVKTSTHYDNHPTRMSGNTPTGPVSVGPRGDLSLLNASTTCDTADNGLST